MPRATMTGELRSLRALVDARLHTSEIARQLDRSTFWVSDWCRRLNLKARSHPKHPKRYPPPTATFS